LADGLTAERVRPALTAAILRLPQPLRRSLTWDHGREMAEQVQFTVDSGVQVFFCDPRSPWQRGTNENTNGLLRQYLARGADLRRFDQAALEAIAAELNGRPRQTLGFKTPSQAFAEALREPPETASVSALAEPFLAGDGGAAPGQAVSWWTLSR
jgi:IS30 family transposase